MQFALIIFAHNSLAFSQQIVFLKEEYGVDYLKSGFLNNVEGFAFERKVGKNIAVGSIRKIEIVAVLNSYNNYTLGHIHCFVKPVEHDCLRRGHITRFMEPAKDGVLLEIGCGTFNWGEGLH